MKDEKILEALPKVINGLLDRFHEENQKTERYKNMFEASENGIRGLLDHANDEMERIVLDTMQVLEERFNLEVTHDLYTLIKALPFVRDDLEGLISKREGWVCSVDKARELVGLYALDLIKKETEK